MTEDVWPALNRISGFCYIPDESLQQECSYDRAVLLWSIIVLHGYHSLLLQIRKGSRFYAKIVRIPV